MGDLIIRRRSILDSYFIAFQRLDAFNRSLLRGSDALDATFTDHELKSWGLGAQSLLRICPHLDLKYSIPTAINRWYARYCLIDQTPINKLRFRQLQHFTG